MSGRCLRIKGLKILLQPNQLSPNGGQLSVHVLHLELKFSLLKVLFLNTPVHSNLSLSCGPMAPLVTSSPRALTRRVTIHHLLLQVSCSSFLDSRPFKGKQNRQHCTYRVPGPVLCFLSASHTFIHLLFPTSLRSRSTTTSLFLWMRQLRG